MAKISPYGIYRAFNLAGNAALDGGLLYTYEAGTSTPKPTYTDASGNNANTNPVVLDINGTARVWLDVGGYKFVLQDKNGVEQFTEDNIDGGGAAGFASQVIITSTGLTLTSTYQNTVIVCTQPVTLSLVSAGIAGDGYIAIIINQSVGNVTIAPDGAETINGLSSLVIPPDASAIIHTNGVDWYSSANPREFLSSFFRIDDSADVTKKIAFSAASITAGQTRTVTVPDSDLTMVGTTTTQTLSNKTIVGSLPITGTSASAASVVLGEDTDNGVNTVTVIAPAAVASNRTQTLQDADGPVALMYTGSVIQSTYVSLGNRVMASAVTPQDDTIPTTSEGTLVLSGSITPKYATSTLRITATVCGQGGTPQQVFPFLTRNAVTSAIAVTMGTAEANTGQNFTILHQEASGVTTAVTFNLYVGVQTPDFYVNGNVTNRLFGGVSKTSLLIEEIAA